MFFFLLEILHYFIYKIIISTIKDGILPIAEIISNKHQLNIKYDSLFHTNIT